MISVARCSFNDFQEPLARVTFSQVPTCHAVSPFTASPERLDIIVGFASGDLVWLDFIAGRYSRINKGVCVLTSYDAMGAADEVHPQGILNSTAVTSVHFDPRHPHHFIAAFTDATILQFNMFAEDPVFINSSTVPMPWTTQFERQEEAMEPVSPVMDKAEVLIDPTMPSDAEKEAPNGDKANGKNGYDDEQNDVLLGWKNEEFGSLGELSKKPKNEERGTWVGKNPIAAFKMLRKGMTCESRHRDISACRAHLRCQHWPTRQTAGGLPQPRMTGCCDSSMSPRRSGSSSKPDGFEFKLTNLRLTDVFSGYFGALNCVCPDGRWGKGCSPFV